MTKKARRKHSSAVEDTIASNKNKMVDDIDSIVKSQGSKNNERSEEHDRKFKFYEEVMKLQNKSKYEQKNKQLEKNFAFLDEYGYFGIVERSEKQCDEGSKGGE